MLPCQLLLLVFFFTCPDFVFSLCPLLILLVCICCDLGTGSEQFLSKLEPLTPEISEDMEDLLSVETLVIHGSFESGGLYMHACR